jgi:neutral ceramidase
LKGTITAGWTPRCGAIIRNANNSVLNIYQISGDWPGYAQEEIEEAHPGAIALFMQGCGADANPLPRRTIELARLYGKVLSAAVDDVLNSKMRSIEGPIRLAYETLFGRYAWKKEPS